MSQLMSLCIPSKSKMESTIQAKMIPPIKNRMKNIRYLALL